MIRDRQTLGFVVATAILALSVPSHVQAQEGRQSALPPLYVADVDHSSVAFSVLHVGITRVRGTFKQWSAALTWESGDPTRSSVSVVVDVASLDTNSDRRDADLRSDNFFDVARYPTAVFQSTAVRRTSSGFQIAGRLRIKEQARSVTIPAAPLGEMATERSERRGFEGSLTVLREDFAVVNEGNILERLGVIGKDVEIEIQLSALRLKPEGRTYRDREDARSVGAVLEELLRANGIEAAVARYRAALSDNKDSLKMGLQELVTLCTRLALEGRAADAARILAVYVERQPADDEGLFWYGEMLAEAGQRDAALVQYRSALGRNPLRADAAERIRYLTDARGRAVLAEDGRE